MILIAIVYGQENKKTENIILITFDGLRWQEVFGGADSSSMRQQKYLNDNKLKEKFWHNDVGERRKIPEADQRWFAVIGPDTRPLGEIKGQYYQNQVAKTLATFLGFDYKGENKTGDVVSWMIKSK